ncbi:MAG TPA: YihY family inner membrane protein [Campylobacteraceae bacterium]|nr:YihY family inner membrane protein [Campylobacteraceae bacterium]
MKRYFAVDQKHLKAYFIDHNLLHYASSLSFHTMLALIPILLISLYLFVNLETFSPYLEEIKQFIFNSIIPVQQEYISQNIDAFMHNAYKMGALGLIFVLYVSVMFFDDFEYVINKIYGVPPRRFLHSISIYLTMVIIMPLGVAASFYLTIRANMLLQSFTYTHWINLLSLTSYLIIWFVFYVVYKISPNVTVHKRAAFVSSFVASLIWYLSKALFVYYVTFNKTYTTLYGSFSTIMFFLIWIYLSWIIFLYGVKLCHYLNNYINIHRYLLIKNRF